MQNLTQSASSLSLLQAAFPGRISLTAPEVGTACNITPASIRTLRCRGAFRIPSSSNGGKHLFDIRDVADFLDARRKPKSQRGAPTKVQRIARAAAQNAGV